MNRSRSESPRRIRGFQAFPQPQNNVLSLNSSSSPDQEMRSAWYNPNAAAPAAARPLNNPQTFVLSPRAGPGPPGLDNSLAGLQMLVDEQSGSVHAPSASPPVVPCLGEELTSVSSYSNPSSTPVTVSTPRVLFHHDALTNEPLQVIGSHHNVAEIFAANKRAADAEAREKANFHSVRNVAVQSVAKAVMDRDQKVMQAQHQVNAIAGQAELEIQILQANAAHEISSANAQVNAAAAAADQAGGGDGGNQGADGDGPNARPGAHDAALPDGDAASAAAAGVFRKRRSVSGCRARRSACMRSSEWRRGCSGTSRRCVASGTSRKSPCLEGKSRRRSSRCLARCSGGETPGSGLWLTSCRGRPQTGMAQGGGPFSRSRRAGARAPSHSDSNGTSPLGAQSLRAKAHA